jgi:type VI secretion system protein
MAPERSLLERIDDAGQERQRTLRVDPERLAESVLQHLRKMLNVHQGNVPTLPSYGMPDFNDLSVQFPQAIAEIQRSLKTSIENYEPRLKGVRIRHVPDEENPLTLRFEITAQLVTGGGVAAMRFETFLDPSGMVSVRG